MKIYSILIGFLLIAIIKTSSDLVEMQLFKEIQIEQGITYFYAPIYEIDKMALIANFYDVYLSNVFDVYVAGFTKKPTGDDMQTAQWNRLNGYYIYGGAQSQQNYGFYAYQYDFYLSQGVNYIGVYVNSHYTNKVTIYIKSVNHVYEVALLEEIQLRDCFDGYYFKIPAFSNDKMSIDATVYKPYYSQSFGVYIKGLGSPVTDDEVRRADGWNQLTAFELTERTDSDFYSYPFETIEGVANLGFWFKCPYHDQVMIRIYSDTATKIALILLAIFLPLIIIGAVIGVLFKRGCFCRVRIN
jgi:hypothetical protein